MSANLYEQWLESKRSLDEAKKKELALRNQICASHLQDKLEGSKTEHIGNYKITSTAVLNRSLDAEVLDALWEDLTQMEKDCIIYKPSLVLSNYKQIEQHETKLMDAITVKPGTPRLKIEVIKE